MKPLAAMTVALSLALLSPDAFGQRPTYAEAERAMLDLEKCDDDDTEDHEEDEAEGEADPDPCEEATEVWDKLEDMSADNMQVAAMLERVAQAHYAHRSPGVRQYALELLIDSLPVDVLMKRLRVESEVDILNDIVRQLAYMSGKDATAYKAAMRATRAPAAQSTRKAALRALMVFARRKHPHTQAIRERAYEVLSNGPGDLAAGACEALYYNGESALPHIAAVLTPAGVKTDRGAKVAAGCLGSLVRMWATPPRIGPKAAYDLTLKALKLKPRGKHFPALPYTIYRPLEKTMMVAPYVNRSKVVDAIVAMLSDPNVAANRRLAGLLKLVKAVQGQPALVKKVSRAAFNWLKLGFDGNVYQARLLMKAHAAFGWRPKQLGALRKLYKTRTEKQQDPKLLLRDTAILDALDKALGLTR